MTREQELLRNIGLVVAFLLALLFISRCQSGNWTEERTTLLKWNDSVRAEVRFQSIRAIQAEGRANLAVIERNAARDSMGKAMREADRLRAKRTVIRPIPSRPNSAPTPSDTAAALQTALDLCDQETTALRDAIKQDSVALDKAVTTEAELRGALALERQTASQLTTTNHRLQTMLASASAPCRVLFFPCPTRTQVAAGTAIVTAVLTISLTR